ncbi:MAG TPA: DNA polymerase III subunit gamma/tau [Acidimicrobiia bacterium]|nr:DNA polymerase III subunit gamma/tau [Acidimicrobiia bacterium]
MATSLYRKYRPQRFSELVGQEHVARALQNALSEGRLAHAYLFSGTRGTGKTSSARILGAVLNCATFASGFPSDPAEVEPCGVCESCLAARAGNSFDVIELDAASNNGVDDMRELIEKVSYTSAAGGTKVYIIDEVHELTGRASNALLKTLEEPPEHVVFILATTNPEKVLPTIRSRTQHFEFVSLPEDKLFGHAKEILSWEERELDDEALRFVVRKGAGSVRDMLSYLDQVLALNVSSMSELEDAHASSDTPIVLELIVSAHSGDVGATLSSLHELSTAGKEPRAIVENIISVARDCLVISLNPSTSVLLSNHTDKDELKNIGDKCGTNFLRQFILKLGKAVADMRGTASLNPLLTVEIALLSTMEPTASLMTSGALKGVDGDVPARSHAEAQRPLSGNRLPSPATSVSFVQEAPGGISLDKTAPSERKAPVRPAAKAAVPVAGKTARPSLGTDSLAANQEVKAAQPVAGKTARPTLGTDSGAANQDAQSPTKADDEIVTGRKSGTLGALKNQGAGDALEQPVANVKKLEINDIVSSWPKVVSLLSVASQGSINKATPIKLERDVLTFGVSPDEIDEVKIRFKKDAAIIRGFLESMHEHSFRFQIVANEGSPRQSRHDSSTSSDEIKKEKPDAAEESEEKMLAESQEYNPVETALSMFGGEVVE